MSKPEIGIIAGEFHKDLCDAMVASAQDEAALQGAVVTRVVRVHGSYEKPFIAESMLSYGRFDALVVLGFIERGETMHGEVMGHVVHKALVDISLKHKVPISMGIIGPGATSEQADARKDGYARAAVRAALRSFEVKKGLY